MNNCLASLNEKEKIRFEGRDLNSASGFRWDRLISFSPADYVRRGRGINETVSKAVRKGQPLFSNRVQESRFSQFLSAGVTQIVFFEGFFRKFNQMENRLKSFKLLIKKEKFEFCANRLANGIGIAL